MSSKANDFCYLLLHHRCFSWIRARGSSRFRGDVLCHGNQLLFKEVHRFSVAGDSFGAVANALSPGEPSWKEDTVMDSVFFFCGVYLQVTKWLMVCGLWRENIFNKSRATRHNKHLVCIISANNTQFETMFLYFTYRIYIFNV